MRERHRPTTPEPEPREPEELAPRLPAGVSNALLAREVTGLSMRKPPSVLDLTAGVNADYTAAMAAVYRWFDGLGTPTQSVPELVAMASDLPFAKADGSAAVVHDVVKPDELQIGLTGRAKTNGVQLLAHRDMSDVAGRESEISAALKNLGRIPTSISFGGDEARITATITGTVTGELKSGDTKLTGEVSPSSAKVEASRPGGSAAVEIGDKGVKATLKAGDWVTVEGEVSKESNGAVGWRAEIAIGTLGTLVTPEDVAKVMGGAQETFSKSAGAVLHGLGDPATLKEHGGALADAVSEVAEKAQKSAAAARSGWTAGVRVDGDAAGGISATVTLTWVF
jgi:hypothetical protein